MDIRQSHLQQFAKCPESFRLKYIMNQRGKQSAAASYGTVLHFALQTYWLNNQDIDLAKRTFEHYWNKPEFMGCKPDYYLPRTSWSEYRSHGHLALDEYHKAQITWSKDDQVIGVEIDFRLKIGDNVLTGSIDKLRVTTDKKGLTALDVADWKSGKVPTFLRYNVQFTAYIWATFQDEFWDQIENGDEWREEVKDLPRTATWVDLKSVPFRDVSAGTREESDFIRLRKACDNLARSVEEDIFVPTLGGESCSYCDFWSECGLAEGNLISGDAERFSDPGQKDHFGW